MVTLNQEALRKAQQKFAEKAHLGKDLLDYFTAEGFKVWYVGDDKSDNQSRRWWISGTCPKHLEEMFNLRPGAELLIAYLNHTDLQPRSMHSIAEKVTSNNRYNQDVVLVVAPAGQAYTYAKNPAQNGFSIIPIDLSEQWLRGGHALKTLFAEWLPVYDRYKVTTPIMQSKDLYGRDDDISDINFRLDSHQSVGLFGLRKAGKTSVLRAVRQSRKGKGKLTIEIDLSEIKSPRHFVREILLRSMQLRMKRGSHSVSRNKKETDRLIAEATRLGLSSVTEAGNWVSDEELLEYWFDDLKSIIRSYSQPLELYFDEVDTIFDGPGRQFEMDELDDFYTIMRQLRALLQKPESDMESAVLLCAGVDPSIFEASIRANGRNNQLYKVCEIRYIKPLGKNDTALMVRKIGELMGVKYGPSATTEALYNMLGGHPLLTRLVCSRVCENRPRGTFPWSVSVELIENVAREDDLNSPRRQVKEIAVQFQQWFPEEAEYLPAVLNTNHPDHTLVAELVSGDSTLLEHAQAYGILNDRSITPRIGLLGEVI